MSWGMNVVGKASTVAEKVAVEIARIKCSEPEETIKNQAGAAIATALNAFPENSAVEVVASGSQSKNSDGTATNNLSVVIKPLYGFVE